MTTPSGTSLNARVLTIVGLFAVGLVGSAVMRLLHLRADAPPAWTGLSTEVYVILTALAHGASNSIGLLKLYASA